MNNFQRHLEGLGFSGWTLDHLLICETCELDSDLEGVRLDKCEIARAHEEMVWELRYAEIVPGQSSGSHFMQTVDAFLRLDYLPALKEQIESSIFFFNRLGGNPNG